MIRKVANISFVFLLGASIFGCTSDKLEGPGKENQAPTVWLSAAPPEGTVSGYTLHLYWGGWDPDGEIAYYEYAITDNEGGVFDPADTTGSDKWFPVFRNESIFTFTADQLADSAGTDFTRMNPLDYIRSHSFFIRAVDDEGLATKIPAYRSFTSRTLSPIVDVLVPTSSGLNPAQVPPITTFRWVGRDYVGTLRETQEPDSVRWIIVSTELFDKSWNATIRYVRENPDAPQWSDWHYYRATGDTGKFWTSPALEYGPYVFAVQVKDEAGAVNPVFDEHRNVRRVMVSKRTSGPLLTVYNKFIGTMVTTSPNTPLTIIDLPAKVPMSFRWEADASNYGGVVSGYRYGWDIQDLNEDDQWDIDWTPFVTENNSAQSPPRTYEFDSHTFHIEVVDNSGFTSRTGVRVNVVPFTMTKNVLLIDDWEERSPGFDRTNGGLPSDTEHDEFWADMLADVDEFDPSVDMIEVQDDLPINALADYRTLIWVATAAYNSTTGSLINEIIQFVDPDVPAGGGKTNPNIVSLFMSAGGHVLLCGEQVMTASINRISFLPNNAAFPLIFRYELTSDQDGEYEDSDIGERGVGEESFPYQDCCLNVLDIAYIRSITAVRRTLVQSCAVNMVRSHSQKNDGLRYTIPMDDKYDFPQLELRDKVGGPGRWYDENVSGLNCDIYNPLYFADVEKGLELTGVCNDVAELIPARECFKPMYGNGCLNPSSLIYGAPVAFWTLTYEDRVPDAGGVAARSAVWGFHPVFFKPEQVKPALDIILFDEWQLLRRLPRE
ncbi:MAG: hypothetical protein JSW58_01560 [Candidatus Latescibacterota bacterium]|nr:MAG: hypothetical protein JSW58_01560 [Candidatus Latescibacterota bacterium]